MLSSTNQLYSGIGRNLFDLASRMGDRIVFEFAIDDQCGRTSTPPEVLRSSRPCDARRQGQNLAETSLDVLNEDLPALLGAGSLGCDRVPLLGQRQYE